METYGNELDYILSSLEYLQKQERRLKRAGLSRDSHAHEMVRRAYDHYVNPCFYPRSGYLLVNLRHLKSLDLGKDRVFWDPMMSMRGYATPKGLRYYHPAIDKAVWDQLNFIVKDTLIFDGDHVTLPYKQPNLDYPVFLNYND